VIDGDSARSVLPLGEEWHSSYELEVLEEDTPLSHLPLLPTFAMLEAEDRLPSSRLHGIACNVRTHLPSSGQPRDKRMHSNTHIYTHTQTHTHTHTHTHAHTHTRTHTHTYVHTNTHAHMRTHVNNTINQTGSLAIGPGTIRVLPAFDATASILDANVRPHLVYSAPSDWCGSEAFQELWQTLYASKSCCTALLLDVVSKHVAGYLLLCAVRSAC